jgi:hypothetical protein
MEFKMNFIKRKFVWLILSLAVFTLQTMAQEQTFDDSVLSENGKQAYQTILKVEMFAIGGIGEGGTISKGEEALNILIREKESILALKYLVKKATPEGGLYALFGLKELNCECFEKELKTFESLPEPSKRELDEIFVIGEGEVKTMHGCLITREKRLEVAQHIKNGQIR